MPMGFESLGRILLVIGAAVFVLGLILILVGRIPLFGRLPGDIFIQRDNVSVWIPIVSMIVLSIALTVIVNLIGWFLRR